MKNAAMGIALGVGISASVLASAYMMNRDESTPVEDSKPRAVKVASGPDCWNETITVTKKTKDHTVAGTMIGGALGGLAGNQFGKGDGKTAATAAGAVAGAMIGRNQTKPDTYQETQVVRRCR